MQEQEEAHTGQVGMMPRVCTDYMGAAMNHRHCVHGAGAGQLGATRDSLLLSGPLLAQG